MAAKSTFQPDLVSEGPVADNLGMQQTGHSKPNRTIRLLIPPRERGVGVFRITLGHRAHHYTFREIPCEIGGRGFAVHRLGLGVLFHVRVGKAHECTCECLGFLSRGYCRHILGLRALIQQGVLPEHPHAVSTF